MIRKLEYHLQAKYKILTWEQRQLNSNNYGTEKQQRKPLQKHKGQAHAAGLHRHGHHCRKAVPC